NAQGELVFMSQSFLDMAGLELKDVVDGSWLSRMPRDDGQRFAQAWVKKDQSTGPWEFEYRIRSADGRLHNIHSRGVRMADDRGDPQGWIGVNFDITDSKRSLNRLSFLAEAGRLLASSLDPDTTLDRIATLCVPQLADWCTIEILDE